MFLKNRLVTLCSSFVLSSFLALPAGAQQRGSASSRAWNDVTIQDAKRFPEWTNFNRVYRLVRFDAERTWQQALAAPHEDRMNGAAPATIKLPLPDGSESGFKIIEYDVLAQDSQSRYPWIRTYYGWGEDNPLILLRLTVTNTGVFAQIAHPEQGAILIDPLGANLNEEHVVYYKRDHERRGFDCNPLGLPEEPEVPRGNTPSPMAPGDTLKLRRISVAIATTDRWGAKAGAAGGTYAAKKALAFANLADGVNRMNQPYEREIGVRMRLAWGNDLIVHVAREAIGSPNEKQKVTIAAVANPVGSFRLKFARALPPAAPGAPAPPAPTQMTADIKLGTDTAATIKAKLEAITCIGTDPSGVTVQADGGGLPIAPGDTFVVEFTGALVRATDVEMMTVEAPAAGVNIAANVAISELVAGNGIRYPFTATAAPDSADDYDIDIALVTKNHNYLRDLNTASQLGDYDMGHLLLYHPTMSDSGAAITPAACIAASKGKGATRHKLVNTDPYWIDYVAHELGHEMGANHTFNGKWGGCGNLSLPHAYEPGGGTTIMAYAGICHEDLPAPPNPPNTPDPAKDDDIQKNSNDYFHVESLNEINAHMTGGGGCGALLDVPTDKQPDIDFDLPANKNIPIKTPFWIKAVPKDDDNPAPPTPPVQVLTVCVEQFDRDVQAEITTADNGAFPLFRSLSPTTSVMRFFPRFDMQFKDGATWKDDPDGAGPQKRWAEQLPSKARAAMKFKATVRDNVFGTHNKEESLTVVEAAGPFEIVHPVATPAGWAYKGCVKVKWNIKATDAAPISAAEVRILLSTNGGQSFKNFVPGAALPANLTELVATTPNGNGGCDPAPAAGVGCKKVILPEQDIASARIMVLAKDRLFFAISPAFRIAPTAPLTGAPTCQGDFDGNGYIDVDDLLFLIAVWGFECDCGCNADLDSSGVVDTGDLVALINSWGQCPP